MGSLLFRGFGEGDGVEEEGEDGETPSSWQKLDLLDLTTVTSRRGGAAGGGGGGGGRGGG